MDSSQIFIIKIFLFLIKKTHAKMKGFVQGEWNWPIYCLNDSENQESRELKSKKFPGGARTPLEVSTLSAHLGNLSVFILDPCQGNPT